MESAGLRLSNAEHGARPWRIHEITSDFRLEDLWALPEVGGPNEFAQLVRLIASLDPSQSSSCAVRLLFSLRWTLGDVFGWDNPDTGLDVRVPTLRDRLPPDLRDGPAGPESAALPFRSLYLTENEWAAETANKTVHGVLHIGGVPDGSGGYGVRMAVLVKPNGLFGDAYMAAIKPFRYLLVYPAIHREIGRQWRGLADGSGQEPTTVGSAGAGQAGEGIRADGGGPMRMIQPVDVPTKDEWRATCHE